MPADATEAANPAPEEAGFTNTVPSALPEALFGAAYDAELSATGGIFPHVWTIQSGRLPDGFALVDGHIVCGQVATSAESWFSVRVTDAAGNCADAQTLIRVNKGELTLAAVRRRGAFFFNALICALALAGPVLLLRGTVDLESFIVDQALRFRSAVGISPVVGGPDWYMIAAMAIGPGFGVMLLLAGLVWYRRTWSQKLAKVWGKSSAVERLRQIQPIPDHCSSIRPCPHCEVKIRYLRDLLSSTVWQDSWPTIRSTAHVPDQSPSTLGIEQYVAVSNAVFAVLEKDIAERALTTGLVVGVGRSRWLDPLTIVAGSFELQMFVLGMLGKRPGLRLWLRMLQRCSASLFLNAYLNRGDVFALNLVIKKTAFGLHAAAESVDWASEQLKDAIHHHGDAAEGARALLEHLQASGHLDSSDVALLEHLQASGHHLDSSDVDADDFHRLGGSLFRLVAGAFFFTLSVGSVALHQIAAFVEHASDALIQGTLAGGILYWQGCDLTAEVLALNRKHRDSEALTRTVLDGAKRMATTAGEILKVATRQLRSMYRERRRNAITSLGLEAVKRGKGLFTRGS